MRITLPLNDAYVREMYAVGVSHTIELGEKPTMTTTIEYERGWDIVAEEPWAGGLG
jgi:hypothetical protein